jgi:hypothetical protein
MRLTPPPSSQHSPSPPTPAPSASTRSPKPPRPPKKTTDLSFTDERTRPKHRISSAPATRTNIGRMLAAAAVTDILLAVLTADSAQASTIVLAFATSVGQVFDNIRNWLVGILAGLATVFLTAGGVRYLMAGGDPGEREKAKGAFKSAAWGYGLAALAPLVVEILRGIVGG